MNNIKKLVKEIHEKENSTKTVALNQEIKRVVDRYLDKLFEKTVHSYLVNQTEKQNKTTQTVLEELTHSYQDAQVTEEKYLFLPKTKWDNSTWEKAIQKMANEWAINKAQQLNVQPTSIKSTVNVQPNPNLNFWTADVEELFSGIGLIAQPFKKAVKVNSIVTLDNKVLYPVISEALSGFEKDHIVENIVTRRRQNKKVATL